MPHIHQLPSGTWRVIVKYKGSRSTGTAPTKAAARVRGAQLLLDLGARQTADTIPVGELLDGHLARAEWSPTTLTDSRRVAGELPDAFRARPVSEVDGAVLAGLYRQLTNAGWSGHKVRRAHFVISTAWAEAILWGWAHINPARSVKLPKVNPRDIHPPDTEQVLAVLDQADGAFSVFLRLAAMTGARRGEIVALQWADVDLERGQMWIARSLVAADATIYVRDGKTSRKGHRMVQLDSTTIDLLRDMRDRQAQIAGDGGGPTPVWVFSHTAGFEPWRPDHPSRLFRHACTAAGISGVRLHDLRHYVATSMLQDGETPLDVAAQLGHASTRTTLEVYAHFMPGRGRDSAIKRAGRLDKRSAGAGSWTPPVD